MSDSINYRSTKDNGAYDAWVAYRKATGTESNHEIQVATFVAGYNAGLAKQNEKEFGK